MSQFMSGQRGRPGDDGRLGELLGLSVVTATAASHRKKNSKRTVNDSEHL
jgi:hypothetical protein